MTDTAAAITLLLAKAAEEFSPIIGQPTADDIFKIRKALMPILHKIEYANFVPAGGNAHNLVGLIQETLAYVANWNAAFPRPARPAPYDITINDNATNVLKNRMEAASVRLSTTTTPTLQPRKASPSSSRPLLTRSGIKTYATR